MRIQPTKRPEPLPRGGLIEAIRGLKPGFSVELPTSGQSAVNTIGHLCRRGEIQRGQYTVRSLPGGKCVVWHLANSA